MDAYTPVVKRVTQLASYDAGGRQKDQIRVEYNVGSHGPFYEVVDKADFNGPKMLAVMQATADSLRSLGATGVK